MRGPRADFDRVFLAVVCLNRRFTYALMSVMVLIIMAYAIAKGVTFFNREKGKEEDGGSLKSTLLASQSSGRASSLSSTCASLHMSPRGSVSTWDSSSGFCWEFVTKQLRVV